MSRTPIKRTLYKMQASDNEYDWSSLWIIAKDVKEAQQLASKYDTGYKWYQWKEMWSCDLNKFLQLIRKSHVIEHPELWSVH